MIYLNKKRIVAISGIAAVVLCLAGGFYYLANRDSLVKPSNAGQIDVKQACDLYSLKDAQDGLGGSVKQIASQTSTESKSPGKKDSSSQAITTSCDYESDPKDRTTVLVRSLAKGQGHSKFTAMRPSNATDVNDIGEAAYEFSGKTMSGQEAYQIQVLKSDYIVIVAGLPDDADRLRSVAKTAVDRLKK